MPHSHSTWIRTSTRLAIYLRDHFDCVYCRSVFPRNLLGYGLTLDHVNGIDNAPSNLVTACPSCNSSRMDLPLAEWLTRRFPDRTERGAIMKRVRRQIALPIDYAAGRHLAEIRKVGIRA